MPVCGLAEPRREGCPPWLEFEQQQCASRLSSVASTSGRPARASRPPRCASRPHSVDNAHGRRAILVAAKEEGGGGVDGGGAAQQFALWATLCPTAVRGS